MAGKPTFAEFTAALSADDDELQKDLKTAESATKRSAEVMQSNLDRVAISGKTAAGGMRQYSSAAVGAGEASRAASQSIGALGVAASASGNQFIGLAVQIGSVAAASDELALALSGVGKTGVLLLKTLGPIAIGLAVVGGAFSIVTRKIDAFHASLQAGRDAIKQSLAGPQKELELLELQIKERKGELTAGQVDLRRALIAGSANQEEFNLRLKILDLRRKEAAEVAKIAATAQREATGAKTRRAIVLRDFNDQRAREAEEKAHGAAQLAIAQQRREEAAKAAQSRLENLQGSAQALLVQTGAAQPSDFIEDPEFKRLALLGELIGDRDKAAAAVATKSAGTGSFGLSRVQSPLAVVRGGEVIGRQTLTIQEQTKQIVADHRDISREVRDILRRAIRESGSKRSGTPLTVTDRA
jgi:hypothetical protein